MHSTFERARLLSFIAGNVLMSTVPFLFFVVSFCWRSREFHSNNWDPTARRQGGAFTFNPRSEEPLHRSSPALSRPCFLSVYGRVVGARAAVVARLVDSAPAREVVSSGLR